MSVPEIPDYVVEKEIGRGSFSSVRVGRHKITQAKVAIKVVNKKVFAEDDLMVRFEREVQILKDLNHPFVAEFYDLLEDENNYYIIMEYVENGNMLNYVNREGELNENLARHYFCQLISVLEYLHVQKQIVHRDLKAENILLDKYYNIRLIDFGLSNFFSADKTYLETACGSPAYASPEMVKGNPYNSKSDIWSAGILLFAMCAGELPYEDDNVQKLLQKIAFKEPVYPSSFSLQLKDLLRKILSKDPERRLTIDQIKQHPWFSQYEYSNIMNMDFGVSRSWRVRRSSTAEDIVDREIVQQMMSLGIDTSKLTNALLCEETNSYTAIYRMLRKAKITSQMGEIGRHLQKLPIPRLPKPFTTTEINPDLGAKGAVRCKPIKIPTPQRRSSNVQPHIRQSILPYRENAKGSPTNIAAKLQKSAAKGGSIGTPPPGPQKMPQRSNLVPNTRTVPRYNA